MTKAEKAMWKMIGGRLFAWAVFIVIILLAFGAIIILGGAL